MVVFAATHYVAGDEHRPAGRRLDRGRAAGAAPGVRTGGQAARGPAAAGPHRARPRDAGRDRRVLGDRELQPPPRRPGAGRDPVHAARLLPQGLPGGDRREPCGGTPAARPVCGRPLPQGRPGRARLPPALGPATTARCVSRSSSSGCPRPSSCRPPRARSSWSTRPRWSSRSSGRPAWSTPRSRSSPPRARSTTCMARIDDAVEAGGRVLVTTLTKKMAEDLTDYLADAGVRVQYLHSDIDTITRIEILRELRLGTSTSWSASTCCARASTCPRWHWWPSSTPTRRGSCARPPR